MPSIPTRRRPSASLVVSFVALSVALGGTSYAAVTLPKNSVGSTQIRKSAVTSVKVKDRSLVAKDFKAGQLPAGARGATGAAGPAGPKGDAGPAGAKGESGPAGSDAVPNVTVSELPDALTTTAGTPEDVAGLAQSITIPQGAPRRIVAALTAESLCTGPEGTWCTVQILVDGAELAPAGDTDFAFDSPGLNNSSSGWESHAVQRASAVLSPGQHDVRVSVQTVGSDLFRVDDALLTTTQIAG